MKFLNYILFSFLLFCHFSLNAQWQTNGVNITTGGIRTFLIDTVTFKLYIGGNYMKVSNNIFGAFGYYNDTSFKQLNNIIVDADIFASIFFNSKIVIGGYFLSLNGDSNCKSIAQWDGNQWKPMGAGFNSTVWNLRVIDGVLYAMGSYTYSGIIPLNGIAKWNGNAWENVYNLPQFWNTPDNIINDACLYKNELYIGGNFQTTDYSIIDIVKYNGSSWESVGGGLKGSYSGINKMLVYKDKLVVSGLFYKQDGNTGNFIMTWDGQQWEELGGGTWGVYGNLGTLGTIYDMMVYKDKLYICGLFNYAGSTPASHVAVWDGEKWCGYPGVFDNSVYAMTIFKDTINIACGLTIDSDTVNWFAKWGGGLVPDTCGLEGINNLEFSQNVLVYPNPCSDNITLELPNQTVSDAKIEVIDYTGRICIVNNTIKNNKICVNTRLLAQGIYILKVSSGNKVYYGKFIKQ